MKKLLLYLNLLFFSHSLYSQENINGLIVDGLSNETLIGANVFIKNTNLGTATDFNGNYTIKYNGDLPVTLSISYIGYKNIEVKIDSYNPKPILLYYDSKNLKEVKVIDNRITQKQKESALTVEALDMIAIKETPSANFYDGLGALKGVDITSASLGFKVINTRGFNSTSPVRSLQIINGVDNQSPGLNFSLGNFLGSSELDIMKVEIIQGASSAYYGPNAFNGVVSMTTLSPFIKQGLLVQYKFGSRKLFENSFRLANKFQNKKGEDYFAYKINVSYMMANDWEANNMSAVDGTTSALNPGGYDAVNRYGDEDTDGNLNDVTNSFNLNYLQQPGLKKFHRTGYLEKDIVDYNTKNFKAQSSIHYKIKPEIELIYSLNYSTGTTVYQGDNRFSLKNIQFWQNKLEIKQDNKFFIRAYKTNEDAGDSYDAVFTALRLQEYNQTDNEDWYSAYKANWNDNFNLVTSQGFPNSSYNWTDIGWGFEQNFTEIIDPITGLPGFEVNYVINGNNYNQSEFIFISDSVLNANTNLIIASHDATREQTDIGRLIPGSDEFNVALEEITSKTSLEGGTGFYDKSSLNHIHSEYQFNPKFAKIKIGANFRQYNPDSKGSLFLDSEEMITNNEVGLYSGFSTDLFGEYLKISGTIRADKNENFNINFSPALSIVLKPSSKDILRLSISSAIRNPTLSDQYLYYNVGRAILIGNLNGHGIDYGENLVTIESLTNYYLPVALSKDSLKFFSIDPIQPEKAKSVEIGYRTTIADKIYMDMNYYYSYYTDFIGYKVGAKFNTLQDDTLTGAYEIALPSIQAYRMAANAENTVTTQGASIGINYYIHSNYSINGNYSWNKLNLKGTDDPIIPAYNTPENKFNLSLTGRDLHFSNTNKLFRDFSFSINYKWVEEFMFEGSPQFTGIVPTYDIIDIQISKNISEINANIKIGATNLFNNNHFEVYGGPYIGRMIYSSLLFDIE
ncbi:MAG: TonB-dependent receptor plug domain-containing protein [Flavobacteriales bacterium]|nr:TonB-dependent receptor plug domain-containing protein [Flavobacteriales bacterium]